MSNLSDAHREKVGIHFAGWCKKKLSPEERERIYGAQPPAPVSQAREGFKAWWADSANAVMNSKPIYKDIAEAAYTAAEKRAREKALEDACGMMCPRCKKGHKPQQQDRDGYISNFGPVSYGEWLHPWAEDEEGWRYCEASYIRTALATTSGAAQGGDKQ